MRLLYEICAVKEPKHCVAYYKPAQVLVKRGLAEWAAQDKLAPTAAGRKLIEEDESGLLLRED